MRSIIVVFLVCMGNLSFINEVRGNHNAEELVHDLFAKYDRIADPGNITLDIGLSLIDLEFDSESDVLTASVWERYHWTDRRLAWHPADYGEVSKIILPSDLLWTPDIMVYNVYMGQYIRTTVKAHVKYTGEIMWIPPSVLQVRCSRNHGTEEEVLAKVDGNVITCPIKMGSWTYDGFHIGLNTTDDAADLTVYSVNNKYNVKAFEGKTSVLFYACCLEPYMSYDVSIKLQPRDDGIVV